MSRILDLKPRTDAIYHFIKSSLPDKNSEELIEKIRGRFEEVDDVFVSAYDTAWVAMVPSALHHQEPCFPGCLEWILENQNPDGSWGLNLGNPLLPKDSLSSTLACIIALEKWNAGEKHIQKGLLYIGSKKYAALGMYQSSPIGFDINFPGMIKYAKNYLALDLPLDSAFIELMLHNRDTEIKRCRSRDLAYFAEGLLGESSYDWKEIIKNGQGSNGSLFNSPAATAAVLINVRNKKCYEYLDSLLKINHGKVPTIYPFRRYTCLCMVDTIDRLGLNRYFEDEIKIILDEIYRCWEEKSEEIYSDVSCCSMAFLLLRKNGYQVSSDALEDFTDEERFLNTSSPQFRNTSTVIQLYRASEMSFFEKEPVLDKINGWTTSFLRHQLINPEIYDDNLLKEVKYVFQYPIDNVPGLTNMRGIQIYNTDSFRMLKTSHRCSSVNNRDFLVLSQQEFNRIQQIHLEEYKQVEEWVKKHKIGGLEFEWHVVTTSYFLGAASYISPELSDARIIWAKYCIVGTIIDDLFDIDGTEEEILNLLQLIQNWDGDSDADLSSLDYSSERIEFMFLALTDIINEQAAIGLIRQGRCIKMEIIQIWRDYLNSCYVEMDWWANKSTPPMDEYLANGCLTVGAGLWCTSFYFVGIQISQETIKSEEYQLLYKHLGLTLRLFNDYQGVTDEREKFQRKMNGCSLLVSLSGGALSVEEAKMEVRKMIEKSRRELV